MRALALLFTFVFLPLAELYVLLKVGDAIGVLPTIALLFLDSLLGTVLLRSQGRIVWRRFQEAMAAGRMPHREVQDGVAVIFGGAFLITPGFLTDVIGFLLLAPPTRRPLVRLISRRFAHLMVDGVAARAGAARAGATRTRRPAREADVEGSATEYPPRDPPRIDP